MKKIIPLLFALLSLVSLNAQNEKTSSDNVVSDKIFTVSIEKFTDIIRQDYVLLLDVRTPKEFEAGHIYGATNIDVNAADFAERVKKIEGKVAVYCRSGKRSMKAADILAAQGCTVYNLRGGMLSWSKDWWTPSKD